MPAACIILTMNRLPGAKRTTILNLLVEGSSLRSISCVTGTSINTVTKLLVDAGETCAAYHDKAVRNVPSRRIQVDEIWSFTYAKSKNVLTAKAAPDSAGDTWTWTALDADSKLIVSWMVGSRNTETACYFIRDLGGRLRDRIQLTSDGFGPYINAVEDVFGSNVDFAQLVKLYNSPADTDMRYSPARCRGAIVRPVTGNPDPKHVSTSYVERQNLNLRMGVRRFTRLTNAFSKKIQNHVHALALYYVWYNWCRRHTATRVTPAQEAGLTDTWHDTEWIVGLIDEHAPKPQKPGPKPGTKYRPRKSN